MNGDASSLQQIRVICKGPSFSKHNYMICISRIPRGRQRWCAMGLAALAMGRRVTAASTALFLIFPIQLLKEKSSMSNTIGQPEKSWSDRCL